MSQMHLPQARELLFGFLFALVRHRERVFHLNQAGLEAFDLHAARRLAKHADSFA